MKSIYELEIKCKENPSKENFEPLFKRYSEGKMSLEDSIRSLKRVYKDFTKDEKREMEKIVLSTKSWKKFALSYKYNEIEKAIRKINREAKA